MRLDILGMQAFVSIAEQCSFKRAADALNISQTALSHRLAKFEAGLGVVLINRTTRQVSLTSAGETFLPGARQAIGDCVNSMREMRALAGEDQKYVSFGCLPALSGNILPQVIKDFVSRTPDITVRLFDQRAPEIIDGVLSDELEFGVAFADETHHELVVESLVRAQYVVVCARNSLLAAMPTVSAQDLGGTPLIRLGQNDIGHLLVEERLAAVGTRMRWTFQVQHAVTAIRLAAAGLGTALLPDFSVHPNHDQDVVAVPFEHSRAFITLGIVTRRERALSAPATALIDCFRAAFRVT